MVYDQGVGNMTYYNYKCARSQTSPASIVLAARRGARAREIWAKRTRLQLARAKFGPFWPISFFGHARTYRYVDT